MAASRIEAWYRTARAAALLCLARLLIGLVPFRLWRRSLGPGKQDSNPLDPAAVRRLAAHIERAAQRLPFKVKCLPQAMALSWQLRRRGVGHRIVFAVRPPGHRDADDTLHAWIERQDRIILGDLPGPWLQVFELSAR